jgi:hypothetical protein
MAHNSQNEMLGRDSVDETAPGTPGALEGKDEYYTTYADIDIVAEPL